VRRPVQILLGVLLSVSIGAAAQIPLPVPAQGRSGFIGIPSLQSGITFTNRLSRFAAARNQNLMNGSGVAAGDFDGDGRCDLYFCAISGTNALYRNLGNWRFEEVGAAAGVACPNGVSTGAVFADVDGDGDLDLLVSTLGSGVHCFRNDGQSHFSEVTAEAGLTSQVGSTSLALSDIDGDGDLDLYVANYGALSVLRSGGRAGIQQVNGKWVVTGPHAHRLRFVEGQLEEVGEVGLLYLNDGHGHFQAEPWSSTRFVDEDGKPKAAPADYGLSVQIRDINGDGSPDIYVCNDFQTPDRLWLNDGTGHFREASHLAIRKFPFSSMGVDFADVDRDGNLDFLAVEMAGRRHSRRLRQVAGLTPQPNIPGMFQYRPEVNRNTLYHANGDDTWSEIAEFSGVAATDWSWQPVFLDVDLDGYEDLLVVSGMMYDVQDRDTLALIRSLGKQTPDAARTNLLAYPEFPSPHCAFRNRGDLVFEDRSSDWGFNASAISQGIAVADLDGDGYLDLAINNLNSGAMLYRNTSSSHRILVRLKGKSPNTQGIGGRIRVLGGPVVQTQEIVSGGRYLSGDDPVRMFATAGTHALTIEVTWRSGKRSVVDHAAPDFLYEIDESDARTAPAPVRSMPVPWFSDQTQRVGMVHPEELYDDFARQPLLTRQLSSLGPGIAWADLRGTGQEGLFLGTGRGGGIQGRYFQSHGTTESVRSVWTAPDDVTGLTAWVDAQGRPAILAAVAHYETTNEPVPSVILIQQGTNRSELVVSPLTEIQCKDGSPGPVAAADIDGDGDLDLFVGGRVRPGHYPEPVQSWLFRQDDGKVVDISGSIPGWAETGLVSGAVWSDLDGDGHPELVLAEEWGPIRIFRQEKGAWSRWDPPVTRDENAADRRLRLSSLTGWWSSVTTGDFDGDGRMDLVAGNWGWNSAYKATLEQPLRVYYGDFGGMGMTDLIEAYYPEEGNGEVPRRSLNALGRAMPALTSHYASHKAFSLTTTTELLSVLPPHPRSAGATTLASIVLLNRGDHLEAVSLPAEAQFSPVLGLAVADMDGDGNEDLFLAQNFFSLRPEWPRTDAGRGLWLRGDGRGHFTALSGAESGVRVYGEQRGAAVGDFDEDGRPDLAVAQNGAATTLWHNDRAKPGLRVRLEGPRGNPHGIGAMARLRFGDRLGAAREWHAGSGYWSQDSSVQVLALPAAASAMEVRWPGGGVTTTPVPPDARDIEVHRDGRLERRR